MHSVDYITVFDVTTAGYKNWSFPAFGLGFVVIGFVLLWLERKGLLRKASAHTSRWLPVAFTGFAVLSTTLTFVATYGDYQSSVAALKAQRVKVVEGVVSNFHPTPAHGHAMESFSVAGLKFEYSDFVLTAGFNRTASHGGPIHEGLPVRIWYQDGKILRLDISPEPRPSAEAR